MALSVEQLAVHRGGRALFRDLSFALAPGEALLLRGPNGSGKSSLLRLLAGFLPPAAGAVSWQGQPAEAEPEAYAAALRYLGHQDAVQPQIAARDNLVFWARLLGLAPAAAADQAERALEAASLGKLAHLPGRYLSAGQKRRLALSRLLLKPAPLWLLDEPTNALDDQAIAWLGGTLAAHRAAGGIVLLASHVPVPLPGARVLQLPEGRLA